MASAGHLGMRLEADLGSYRGNYPAHKGGRDVLGVADIAAETFFLIPLITQQVIFWFFPIFKET